MKTAATIFVRLYQNCRLLVPKLVESLYTNYARKRRRTKNHRRHQKKQEQQHSIAFSFLVSYFIGNLIKFSFWYTVTLFHLLMKSFGGSGCPAPLVITWGGQRQRKKAHHRRRKQFSSCTSFFSIRTDEYIWKATMANAEFIKEWRKTLIAHDPDHDAQQSLPSMVSKTNAATTLRPISINKTTRRRESYQQDRDRKTNPTTIQKEMNGLKCCAQQCVCVFLNLGLILSLRAQ